jgi:hypothetical protein
MKPKQAYTGRKSSPIEIEIKSLDAIKGPTTRRTKGIYTLPAIETKTPNGQVLRVWLSTQASGQELTVTAGKAFIIYARKSGISGDDESIRILRIDPISVKPRLLELLAKTSK